MTQRYVTPIALFTLLLSVLIAPAALAQETEVATGPELEAAVTNASAGETILLTQSDTPYLITNAPLTNTVPITIAPGDDVDDPVITVDVAIDEAVIEAEATLTLEDLIVDAGGVDEQSQAAQAVRFTEFSEEDGNAGANLTLEGVTLKNSSPGVVIEVDGEPVGIGASNLLRLDGAIGTVTLDEVVLANSGRRPIGTRGDMDADLIQLQDVVIYDTDEDPEDRNRLRFEGFVAELVFDGVTIYNLNGDVVDLGNLNYDQFTFRNSIIDNWDEPSPGEGARAIEAEDGGDGEGNVTIEYSAFFPGPDGAPDGTALDESAQAAFDAGPGNSFEDAMIEIDDEDLQLALDSPGDILFGAEDGGPKGSRDVEYTAPEGVTELALAAGTPIDPFFNNLEAIAGDAFTFQLDRGATYVTEGEIENQVPLVIIAAGSGARPIITLEEGETIGDGLFEPEASLTVEDLVLDGDERVEQVVRMDNGEGESFTLRRSIVRNSGPGESLLRFDEELGDILLDDVLLTGSGQRPISTRDETDANSLIVRESTIYDSDDRIRIEGNIGEILFENVTAHGLPGDAFDLGGSTRESLTFRNTIIANFQPNDENETRAIDSTDDEIDPSLQPITIEFTAVWPEVAPGVDPEVFDDAAEAAFNSGPGNFFEDPEFADPDNGDFTILAGIDSRFADGGADGAQIGDSEYDVLPVELVSFTATADGMSAVLEWQTASETNNAGFEVEQQIASTFQQVGFVEGRGTTNAPQRYTYRAEDLPAGTHTFRLKQVDFDGAFEYSPEVTLTLAPQAFALRPNYPNPFRARTTIAYDLPQRSAVQITVFNTLGQKVATLKAGEQDAGTHTLTWDGRGNGGQPVGSGLYFYRIEAGDWSASRSMVLVR